MMTTAVNAAAERIGEPGLRPGQTADLIDIHGVAAMLGCSIRHVTRQSDAGRMPAPVRIGKLMRWRRDELRAWIAGGCKAVRTVRRAAR